jgi:phosphoribosylformylglycinamidine synthase
LSLGVCNGCQLMVELDLLYPDHEDKPKLLLNKSHKFESGFLGVKIQENNSVMLGNMANMELGIWVAHGEGQFSLPYPENKYQIPLKFSNQHILQIQMVLIMMLQDYVLKMAVTLL